jgi:hypothetical protein
MIGSMLPLWFSGLGLCSKENWSEMVRAIEGLEALWEMVSYQSQSQKRRKWNPYLDTVMQELCILRHPRAAVYMLQPFKV